MSGSGRMGLFRGHHTQPLSMAPKSRQLSQIYCIVGSACKPSCHRGATTVKKPLEHIGGVANARKSDLGLHRIAYIEILRNPAQGCCPCE